MPPAPVEEMKVTRTLVETPSKSAESDVDVESVAGVPDEPDQTSGEDPAPEIPNEAPKAEEPKPAARPSIFSAAN